MLEKNLVLIPEHKVQNEAKERVIQDWIVEMIYEILVGLCNLNLCKTSHFNELVNLNWLTRW